MSGILLKRLRYFLALFFIIAITFIFLDFREIAGISFIKKILYLQFVPSLIQFTHVVSLASAGFIVVLIITALVGRVYCSAICPLGILQDFISRIGKRFRKRKIYRFTKALNFIRYPLLGLTILFMLVGSMFMLQLLDPYSIYGRINTDLAKPVLYQLNNGIAMILEKFNNFFLFPVDHIAINLITIIITGAFLVLITWLSFSKGRLYCNTVCPVGAFLGLISKFSLYKIRINESACTMCGSCSKVCKAQCINIREKSVDFSRCVGCMNCIDSCPENGIHFKLSIGSNKSMVTPNEDVNTNKRSFIASVVGLFIMNGVTSLFAGEIKNVINQRKYPVSPPGSKGLEHFKANCTACHLCVSACPTRVLQPSFLEYGFTGMMQPHMDYKTSFCNYDCTRCSEICPTGAIQPLSVEQKHTTQTGIAIFVKDNCIVHNENTSCGACAEHCPTQAVHMIPYHNGLTIPEVTDKICIGCGACEYACPVGRPHKAIYVDGNKVHQLAELPTSEELHDEIQEDFPF